MGSSWIYWGLTWVGKCCAKVGLANWADLFLCLLWCETSSFSPTSEFTGLSIKAKCEPVKKYKWVREKHRNEPVKSPYGVGCYCDLAVSPTRSQLLWFQLPIPKPGFGRTLVYHIPFVSPRSEPLNLSSPLEVGEEVLVRYPSRTIDPGLSAISEMKKKKRIEIHCTMYTTESSRVTSEVELWRH